MRILILTILSFLSFTSLAQSHVLAVESGRFEAPTSDATDLNWTLQSNQRVNGIIDENFIHYASNYASTIAEMTAVTGSAPTLVSSKLQVNNSGLIKSTTAPKVNWLSVQMVIGGMNTGGTFQQLGPCIVFDSDEYVTAVYDHVQGKFYVKINGTTVMTKTETFNPTGMTLTLTMMREAINVWAQESGGQLTFIGHCENTISNLGKKDSIPTYRYGIYSTQDAAVTHSVTSLRGGAMAGANIFNQRWVRNSDGSPYIRNGKYVITGDWTALGVPTANASQAYRYCHQSVFSLDTSTYEIQSLGHIYITRHDSDGVVRYHGGQDMKLTWYESENAFLWTTVLCDDYNMAINPYVDDPYEWLTEAEVFTETIIDEARFNYIGINRTTYPNLIYDFSNILFIDGQYEFSAGVTNVTRGNGWSLVTPMKFRSADLSNISTIASYSTATFMELCSWIYLNRTYYYLFTSFGVNNYYVFQRDFTLLGNLNFSDRTTSSTYIGGADFIGFQGHGATQYILLTFDTQNITHVDVDGVSKTFIYSLGNCKIYKATQYAIGYEYP